MELGKKYFSVASGGGTGRTLHPDNMAAGPASYGMTDTMGRMLLRGLRLDINWDAQFAGSSSVKPCWLYILRTTVIQTSLIALG